MRVVRVVVASLLGASALLGLGCGNPNQATGTQVETTQEVKDSRAAMQKALQERPDMYASPKSTARRR